MDLMDVAKRESGETEPCNYFECIDAVEGAIENTFRCIYLSGDKFDVLLKSLFKPFKLYKLGFLDSRNVNSNNEGKPYVLIG